jgi:2-methylcitrate dehydratase PrpD
MEVFYMSKVQPPLVQQFANALCEGQTYSSDTLGKAQYCLMDFLTSCLTTGHFSWVAQARDVAAANSAGQTGGAPIIGTPHRVSIQDAAFANAVAGHSLVRDDMHLASVSHLGVVVVPTALALAAQHADSGKRLLEALVCGYEAGCKLGGMLMDVETARKFRPTGMIGAFAAAATAAKLLRLDKDSTAHALAFAANYITGLNEWAAWGSDDMYFHPGIAARNGITAALLAQAGAVAGAGALDGKAGLFSALGKTLPASLPLPFCEEPEIMKVFFKQVPACNYAQTSAQVALKSRQDHGVLPQDIEQVGIHVPYAAAHYPGCDYSGPFESILQARMSIHFNVASALLAGDYHDNHYRDFDNPDIANLATRITVHVDNKLSQAYPARQGARIDINTRDGKTVSSFLDDLLSASPDEIEARFLEAAGEAYGNVQARSLLDALMNLADSNDTNILAGLNTRA